MGNPFCINCNYTFEFGDHNCKCSLGLDSEDRRVKHMINKHKTFGKQEIAATMYQALGSIESSAMPDGEWQRCMDWLSATANGEDAGELLPVNSLEGEQYLNSRDLQINMEGLALEKDARIKKLEYAAKAVIRRGLIHNYMCDDEFEAVIVDLQNVVEGVSGE